MIKLRIKSLSQESILVYKKFVINTLKKLGVISSFSNIPKKCKRITLLKSPHVNKKAREQFQFVSYKGLFSFKSSISLKILKYIMINKPKTVKIVLSHY